jgi:hypothetical protein
MHARLATTMCGIAAVVSMAAGCSETRAGTPINDRTTKTTSGPTTPADTTGTSGSGDRYGAPPVTSPLDATKFLTHPCAALTPQQLRDFNLPTQGRPDIDSAIAKNSGPSCTWNNSDTANFVGVHFVTGNKSGLADVYRAHGEGKWGGYWQETTVDGYPGVFAFTTDGRPSGSCNLFVGISETLAFSVGPQGRLKEKSCDQAKQVAAAVITTMKGGG